MDVKSIIDEINSKNGKVDPSFDISKIAELSKFLLSLGSIQYIGHGAMCICFSQYEKVIKCCKKSKQTIVKSKDIFFEKINLLKENNMPILYPYDVIYDDDYWLVYTQPLCRQIDGKMISYKMCYDFLNFVKKMLEKNIRLSDIYYRNFGIHKNQICLFDFHEIDSFDISSNFMENNLYSLFVTLGKNVGWHQSENITVRMNFMTDYNDGRDEYHIPCEAITFLRSLSAKDNQLSLKHLDDLLIFLTKKIHQKYTDIDFRATNSKIVNLKLPILPSKTFNSDMMRFEYQSMIINDNSIIELQSHTKFKYSLIEDLICAKKITTMLDTRYCIGLKVAQIFPEIHVYLNDSGIFCEKAKKIANDCMIYNLSFTKKQFHESVSKKYELTIYFSLIHHLLQSMRIEEIIAIIHMQTQKYCVIEVPIIGDVLLADVIQQTGRAENYKCLSSPIIFRSYLITNHLRVNKLIRINYGNDNLIRYAFICSTGCG